VDRPRESLDFSIPIAQALSDPEKTALNCENQWTRANGSGDPNNPVIPIDPPDCLSVDTTPIFNVRTSTCWAG
jgi:hypothetical protein